MIGSLGDSLGDAILGNLGRAAGRVQENKPLPADLLESDDAYLVVFDAPGATASDLQVRYIDDRVEVRLDRFRAFYDDYEMTYPGRGLALDGSVTLPDDAVVDAEAASATLQQNGTLHVEIPKVDEAVEDTDEAAEAADEAVEDTGEAADDEDEVDET